MKLKSIVINGETQPLGNLVIIVGPNGAGKTTFLRDLHYQFVKNAAQTDTKWQNLLEEDHLGSSLEEWRLWANNLKEIAGQTRGDEKAYGLPEYLSHQEKQHLIFSNDRRQLVEHLSKSDVDLKSLTNVFGSYFKDQQTVLLSVDTRFWVSGNPSATLKDTDSTEIKPATYLAVNSGALETLNRSLKMIFGKKLFAVPHNHPEYSIDVASVSIRAPKNLIGSTAGWMKMKEIYTAWRSANKIASLQSEGHGFRAAVETLYALENMTKSILFIDEPELHLYPSAKFKLGQLIGTKARRGKQIILSTHDSDLLRGLVKSSQDITFIRINADRTIKVINSKTGIGNYTNETMQTAFEQGAIFVEGISDTYVYRKSMDLKKYLENYSYQVVPTHGRDRLHEGLPFTELLGIKSALVADYDMVLDNKKKERKRGQKSIVLILNAKKVDSELIKKIDNQIEEIRLESLGIVESNIGFQANLPQVTKQKVEDLLKDLETHGLFIVPIGALQDWVSLSQGARPEAIFNRFRSGSRIKFKELSGFLKRIGEYLKNE
jgi:ABC-type multidrug transport system ATPase subunit